VDTFQSTCSESIISRFYVRALQLQIKVMTFTAHVQCDGLMSSRRNSLTFSAL